MVSIDVFSKERHVGKKKLRIKCWGQARGEKKGNNYQKRCNKVPIEEFTEAKCYNNSKASPYIPTYTPTTTHTPTP